MVRSAANWWLRTGCKIEGITVLGNGTKLKHKIVGKISWSHVPGLVYIDVPDGVMDPYVTVLSWNWIGDTIISGPGRIWLSELVISFYESESILMSDAETHIVISPQWNFGRSRNGKIIFYTWFYFLIPFFQRIKGHFLMPVSEIKPLRLKNPVSGQHTQWGSEIH